MNIQITVRHIIVSQQLKQLVHEMCEEVMRTYEDVLNVWVVIEGVNGPYNAGIDKRCHVRARGRDRLGIDINQINVDLMLAIDQAFQRLQQTLNRVRPYKTPRRNTTDVDISGRTLEMGGADLESTSHKFIVDWQY